MKGDTSDVKSAICSGGIAPRCAKANLTITVLNVLQSAD
jgi:hypothetical protein